MHYVKSFFYNVALLGIILLFIFLVDEGIAFATGVEGYGGLLTIILVVLFFTYKEAPMFKRNPDHDQRETDRPST